MPTVLVVSANPEDQDHLDLDEEFRSLQIEHERSSRRTEVSLLLSAASRPEDLVRRLADASRRPDMVIFSGHGDIGLLAFKAENGTSAEVSSVSVAEVFASLDAPPRIVALLSCNSIALAQELTRTVAATIGTTADVPDNVASAFTFQLFQSIISGSSAREAFRLARAHVNRLEPGTGTLFELCPTDDHDAGNFGLFDTSAPHITHTMELTSRIGAEADRLAIACSFLAGGSFPRNGTDGLLVALRECGVLGAAGRVAQLLSSGDALLHGSDILIGPVSQDALDLAQDRLPTETQRDIVGSLSRWLVRQEEARRAVDGMLRVGTLLATLDFTLRHLDQIQAQKSLAEVQTMLSLKIPASTERELYAHTLGELSYEQGDYTQARSWFDEAEANSPSVGTTHSSAVERSLRRARRRAKMSMRVGDLAGAIAPLREAADRPSLVPELELLSAQCQATLGRTLVLAGQTDNAISEVRSAIARLEALAPSLPTDGRVTALECAWINEGLATVIAGSCGRGFTLLLNTVDLATKYGHISEGALSRKELGTTFLLHGLPRVAEEVLSAAIAMGDEHGHVLSATEARAYRVLALVQQERWTDVMQAVNPLLLDATNDALLQDRGLLLFSRGLARRKLGGPNSRTLARQDIAEANRLIAENGQKFYEALVDPDRSPLLGNRWSLAATFEDASLVNLFSRARAMRSGFESIAGAWRRWCTHNSADATSARVAFAARQRRPTSIDEWAHWLG